MTQTQDLSYYRKFKAGMEIFNDNSKSNLARARKATDSASAEVIQRLYWLNVTIQVFNNERCNNETTIPPVEEFIEFDSSKKDKFLAIGKIKFTTLIQNKQLLTMCVFGSYPDLWKQEIASWNNEFNHRKHQIDESYYCGDLRNFVAFLKSKIKEKKEDDRLSFVLTSEEQDRMIEKIKAVSPDLSYALRRFFLLKNENDLLRTLDSMLNSGENDSAIPT